MRLKNKVVLLVGAGGGMGAAVARVFAREGARLALVARRERPLLELASIARSDGGEATICTADASTESGCDAMVDAAVREFGRLDVLYCNLGEYTHGDLELHQTPLDAWDFLIGINLSAHFLCARAAIRQMLNQEPQGGVVIHVAASADVTRQANPGYAAGKAGLIGLVQRAARQYRDRNIRVNCICPGAIGGQPPPPGPLPPPPSAISRPASALDVAHAALYLAADESSWVSGHAIPVEGGQAIL